MDEHTNETSQAPIRRPRKKRSKLQIFKEAYLPFVILLVALILIITFIVGSISRASNKRKEERDASISASESIAMEELRQQTAAQQVLEQAQQLAENLDYQGAIDALDSFDGDVANFPELSTRRAEYVKAMEELVVYNDPSKVPHLSFQMLIADTTRAFADDTYGSAYNRNYVTTDEFSKILQQLYDNNYILVSLHDLIIEETDSDGNKSYSSATLRLPVGKKAIVLSQVAANYFTYMTDGDEDGLPDKDGAGFPYCLALDADGNFVSKMIDAEGNEVTGNFDFVTILEQFVSEHPDFSFQGARATLAVTGYDGIFGYRINSDARSRGSEYYAQQLSGAQTIVDALKAAGYELACNTYNNLSCAESNVDLISGDMFEWSDQITPILGDTDIFFFPYGEDLDDDVTSSYSGEKFDALYGAGMRIFIGMDNKTVSSARVTEKYVRQTRRWVTGAKMTYSAGDFADLFDASTVLNSDRGEVPGE